MKTKTVYVRLLGVVYGRTTYCLRDDGTFDQRWQETLPPVGDARRTFAQLRQQHVYFGLPSEGTGGQASKVEVSHNRCRGLLADLIGLWDGMRPDGVPGWAGIPKLLRDGKTASLRNLLRHFPDGVREDKIRELSAAQADRAQLRAVMKRMHDEIMVYFQNFLNLFRFYRTAADLPADFWPVEPEAVATEVEDRAIVDGLASQVARLLDFETYSLTPITDGFLDAYYAAIERQSGPA